MKKSNLYKFLFAILVVGYFLYTSFDSKELQASVNNIKEEVVKAEEVEKEELDINGDGYEAPGLFKVYYLDVGQADSIFIKTDEKNMLIDAGTNEAGPKIAEFLKSLNVEKIDYLVATHPHEDHIGGMDDIINNFEVSKFYMPDNYTTTKTFEDMITALENKNLKYNVPKIGDEITLGDADFEVLYLDSKSEDLNDSSIILKGEYEKYSFLFMADASSKVEDKLIDSYKEELQSNVLKVGHHGSNTSSSKKFLEYVKPEFAIISVGKQNRYNHPGKYTINRLNNLNIETYKTSTDGSILITCDSKSISVSKIVTNTN